MMNEEHRMINAEHRISKWVTSSFDILLFDIHLFLCSIFSLDFVDNRINIHPGAYGGKDDVVSGI